MFLVTLSWNPHVVFTLNGPFNMFECHIWYRGTVLPPVYAWLLKGHVFLLLADVLWAWGLAPLIWQHVLREDRGDRPWQWNSTALHNTALPSQLHYLTVCSPAHSLFISLTQHGDWRIGGRKGQSCYVHVKEEGGRVFRWWECSWWCDLKGVGWGVVALLVNCFLFLSQPYWAR